MSEAKGKDVLLKILVDGNPQTVAGIRMKNKPDMTGSDRRIEGVGIFKDADSDALVRAAFFSGEVHDWQILIPDFGTVAGPFTITLLEYAGSHDGELSFDIELTKQGASAFMPAMNPKPDMSETPDWIKQAAREWLTKYVTDDLIIDETLEAAMLSVAARVERETREADAQLVDSCSLGNHGLVRLLDDDKTLRPVASAIRSTPTKYREPNK